MDIIINDIAWHSFLLFLWIGSVLATLVGAGLLVAPKRVEQLNAYFARWIDTERIEVEFDRPRWSEGYIYRHHRIIGAALFIGAVIVLYKFLLTTTRQKISVLAANNLIGLFDAAVAVFVIGGVLAAVIGGVMFIRPSMLREFEAAANRWVSTERTTHWFNHASFSFDNCALRHRKIVGTVLTAGGFYISLVLGRVLWEGQWQL